MAQFGIPPLEGLGSLSGILPAQTAKPAAGTETEFSDILSGLLEQYDQTDRQSDLASLELLSGQTDNLAAALIATEKAEIALSLTVAVRNKAIDAYKEIMNMQV